LTSAMLGLTLSWSLF